MGANMLGRHWPISQGDVKGGAEQEASGGLLAQDYFALWGVGGGGLIPNRSAIISIAPQGRAELITYRCILIAMGHTMPQKNA